MKPQKITMYEAEAIYDDMLDDVYGETNICGYTYSARCALKRVDYIAWKVGFSNYFANEEAMYEIEY